MVSRGFSCYTDNEFAETAQVGHGLVYFILNASRVPTSHSAPGGRGFSRNSRNRSRNCGRSSRAGKRRGRGWGRANSETEARECI